jgi:hypothetical protein
MISQDKLIEFQQVVAKKSLIVVAWLALAIVISLGANLLILYLGSLNVPPSYAVTSSGVATQVNNFELSTVSAEALEKAAKNPNAKALTQAPTQAQPKQVYQGSVGVDD